MGEEVVRAAQFKLCVLELKGAIGHNSTKHLTNCLAEAEAMGVEEGMLKIARTRLVEMHLSDACMGHDPNILSEAIKAAMNAGIEARDVNQAKKKFKKMDPGLYREFVTEELDAIVEASEVFGEIEVALEIAEEAGAEKEELAPGRLKAARLAVTFVIKHGTDDIDLMRKAISMSADQGLEEEFPGELDPIKEKLASIEAAMRREAALSALQAAMTGASLDDLKDAIAEAEEAGVDSGVIDNAKAMLS